MIYVALLRGINVGGKNMVSMAELKSSFESLKLERVSSYINSGNIIFQTSEPRRRLPMLLEQQIKADFNLDIQVLLRSLPEMEALVAQIPSDWVDNVEQKCTVLFLWPEVNGQEVLEQLQWDEANESVRLFPGALVWHTTKQFAPKSKVLKVNQLEAYQHMTARNPNTVRKLLALMQAVT